MASSRENEEVHSIEREIEVFKKRAARLMELIAAHAGPECLNGRGPQNRVDHQRFLVVAMAGEAGEALNLVKKHWRGDYPLLDQVALADECADTANYALMALHYLGFDPFAFMVKKLEKFERELAVHERALAARGAETVRDEVDRPIERETQRTNCPMREEEFRSTGPKKIMHGLWRDDPRTPEGKYLVVRRDGTVPQWPHFVLGARDPCVPAALRAYAAQALGRGMSPGYAEAVCRLAEEFEDYRKRHGVGDPDRGRHRIDDPATVEKMRLGKAV